MINKITMVLALIALFLSASAAVNPVFAGQYDGPHENKSILIDKRVGIPHQSKGQVTYEFVDNISTDRYTFKPSDVVFFEIRIKNTSNVALIGVKLSDFEPQYFELFENPGVLINNKDILSIEAGDFAAGEEKVFTVRGRIMNSGNVPSGTTCIINRARAEASNVSDEDTAQFCFNKPTDKVTSQKGAPVKVETIPSTGPEHGLMIMGLASALGYAGTRLKKKVL
jgi:uncharacterized repeat protein (TIGR01451 family)